MTIPGLGQACFKVFYEAAHAEGALDARTKELLHIAVTLALHCEEWTKMHFAVAKKMGITDEELDEVVQLASSVAAGAVEAMADRIKAASGW